VESKSNGTLSFTSTMRYVTNNRSEQIVISRNGEVIIADDNGRERERHKVPYGATLTVMDGKVVKAGQVLATWDPHTRPIITEYAGFIKFENVEEGITVAKQIDDVTGLSSLVVIDPKQRAGQTKGVRPQVKLLDANGNEVKIAGGDQSVNVTFQLGCIITVKDGQEVGVGEVIARIPQESSKTRDITGGLPRVAELFEARRPKEAAIIAEIAGRIEFGKDYKNKRRITLIPLEGEGEPVEYMVAKGKHLLVQEADIVAKGDLLVDGNPVPHDILRILGVEALSNYLVNEIQEVYWLQGVKINDKHIEAIVKQMLQKVEVTHPGDSTLLVGEQVMASDFEAINNQLSLLTKQPAQAHRILQGITKASLQTTSFISAASFQETTRVLTEAAIAGKKDYLVGLKENVIVGRLIPAGTGGVMNELRQVAYQRDRDTKISRADPHTALTTSEGESGSGESGSDEIVAA
jgi:DNA-directed RNA polymerase subunit beta'